MMASGDGGPAFPVTRGHGEVGKHGMTLRDYFAGQALAVLGNSQLFRAEKPTDKAIAKAAYELADVMLVERETTP